jgi:hypothetical protein
LKAAKERKARAEEEAEEKRRAEEAEEAKARRVAEEARRAEEAAEEARKAEAVAEWECQDEKAWEAEAVAEKEKAAKAHAEKEEAKNIRAANVAMEAGIMAHEANKKRVAHEAAVAQVKAQALATRQRNLVKIGVPPDDPLMLVPEGPGPSREEARKIHKEVAGQARKRKLGDTEALVSNSRSSASV